MHHQSMNHQQTGEWLSTNTTSESLSRLKNKINLDRLHFVLYRLTFRQRKTGNKFFDKPSNCFPNDSKFIFIGVLAEESWLYSVTAAICTVRESLFACSKPTHAVSETAKAFSLFLKNSKFECMATTELKAFSPNYQRASLCVLAGCVRAFAKPN